MYEYLLKIVTHHYNIHLRYISYVIFNKSYHFFYQKFFGRQSLYFSLFKKVIILN